MVDAGKKFGRSIAVPRQAIIQSAITGSNRLNHTAEDCPYQLGTAASDLWLEAFELGADPKENALSKLIEEVGTDVAE